VPTKLLYSFSSFLPPSKKFFPGIPIIEVSAKLQLTQLPLRYFLVELQRKFKIRAATQQAICIRKQVVVFIKN